MRFTLFFVLIVIVGFCKAQSSDIVEVLTDRGYENVSSISIGRDLYISYENNLYRFEAKALSNVLSLLLEKEFFLHDRIYLLIRKQDIPMVQVSLSVNDLTLFREGLIDGDRFIGEMHFSFDVDDIDKIFEANSGMNKSFYKVDISVGPKLDYVLGDYSDGLQTRFYLNPKVASSLGKGVVLDFEYNNIVQNDIPGSVISYPSTFRLIQSFRFSDNSFLSANLGYLPQNKFGLQTRFRNYLSQERFYIEFFFDITRLGYLNQDLIVINNRNSDAKWQAIFNYRWNKYDTDINLVYGTFYAGDLGYKLKFERQFNEVFFNLFYARTDVKSAGSFGSEEDGIFGFSLTLPFGQSKYSKPKRIRVRSVDQFSLLYRYSGFSVSGIDLEPGTDFFVDIREYYPEVLRKGLKKYIKS